MRSALRRSLAIVLAALALPAGAEQVDVHLFWRTGCPHCEREIAFTRFQEHGILKIGQKNVRLIDVDRLRAIADPPR